jgi:hypothetical protein
MATAGGQGDQDGLAAVQQRLAKLDADAEALAQELKVVYQALEGAEIGTPVHAARKQRVDKLEASKERVDQRRAVLEAQLSGARGNGSHTCCYCYTAACIGCAQLSMGGHE